MKYKIVQLNLKNCFNYIQFYDYLQSAVDLQKQQADLIIFPENLNLMLLFARKQNVKTNNLRNLFEIWIDKILSILKLNFILNIFDIENQKRIIIEACKNLALKNNSYICTGTYYQKINNEYFNSLSFINPHGEVIAEYHKYKLLGIEKALKIKSVYNPQLISTKIGKIGFCICYDLNDKEYISNICKNNCEILIAPSNGWRLFPGYPFNKIKERPQVQRAIENNVNILRPYCAGWLLPFFYFDGRSHAVNKYGMTINESKSRNETEVLFGEII